MGAKWHKECFCCAVSCFATKRYPKGQCLTDTLFSAMRRVIPEWQLLSDRWRAILPGLLFCLPTERAIDAKSSITTNSLARPAVSRRLFPFHDIGMTILMSGNEKIIQHDVQAFSLYARILWSFPPRSVIVVVRVCHLDGVHIASARLNNGSGWTLCRSRLCGQDLLHGVAFWLGIRLATLFVFSCDALLSCETLLVLLGALFRLFVFKVVFASQTFVEENPTSD